MNDLQIFTYQNNQVRTVQQNGEPWFVAKDVREILEIANTTDAVSRLDSDEVTRFNLGGLSGETNIVSESGLYSLTLGSKKPQAKPFKRWITHEVIPAIRKTGTYSAKSLTPIQMLAAEAQQMAELEEKTNSAISAAQNAQKRIDGAVDALAAPTPVNWQQETGDKIRRICKANGLSYLMEYDALYRELEHSAHVDLRTRVKRMKKRLEKAGYTRKERETVTQLHVISRDPKLKTAFDGIVRRFAAKYAKR